MKYKAQILILAVSVSILSPLTVQAVDTCNAVFSKASLIENSLQSKIDTDLDYTAIKRGEKPGSVIAIMEAATPKNLGLLRELLAKWNLKLDDHGYEVFRRDFLLIRDVIGIHDFESIIESLEKLSSGEAARLQEIAVASRLVQEIVVEKKFLNSSDALELALTATKHGWSYEQLVENFSHAVKLSRDYKMSSTTIQSALELLRNPRTNYLKELEVIKTLEMNYLYISFFENNGKRDVHSIQLHPDIGDADYIIKRADQLARPVEQLVGEMKSLIEKTALDKGAVVKERVQFATIARQIE